jgi:predicted AAA+ superfamily ATPase
MAELSRSTAIPRTTLKRYLTLLEATFLFRPLQAWSANLGKRLVRSPKVHLIDSGLATHLAGHTIGSLARDPSPFGALLETFVAGELRKQAAWSETHVKLFRYRTITGRKVDLVLEDSAGRLVGVEVKASASVAARDFAGLDALAEESGGRLRAVVVLHTGEQTVSFGGGRLAMPVSALWRTGTERRNDR